VSDWVICNSERWWQEAKKPSKTNHITPGVDTRLFVDHNTERNKVLWCAGCTGSNEMRSGLKRVELAEEVFKELKKYDIEGSMLTPDPHGSAVKNSSDMVDWYNTGKVLFVTSEREGVPNVALEAAACGCAIVGTNVGVLPRLLWEGVIGSVILPTVDEFVEAILTNFTQHNDLAKYYIKCGISKFDWSVVAPRYFDVFDKVLS